MLSGSVFPKFFSLLESVSITFLDLIIDSLAIFGSNLLGLFSVTCLSALAFFSAKISFNDLFLSAPPDWDRASSVADTIFLTSSNDLSEHIEITIFEGL